MFAYSFIQEEVCVCACARVCVKETERETERERGQVFVCVYVSEEGLISFWMSVSCLFLEATRLLFSLDLRSA